MCVCVCVCVCVRVRVCIYIYEVKSLSHVRLFVTPWTVAYQASLSMGFSKQEYWSWLPYMYMYIYINMHACVLSRSVVTDSCDFKNCGLPGSFVHRIFQAKILGELPFPTPGYLPDRGIKPPSPTLAGGFFSTETS